MGSVAKPDTDRDKTRPDPDDKSLEGTLVDNFQHQHINGNGKLSLDMEPSSTQKSLLDHYGAVLLTMTLTAVFGIAASLITAGFVLKPATSASVEDLRTSFTAYIDRDEKIEAIKENLLKDQLKDINSGLTELLNRSRSVEIQQVKTDAKVEDIMRFLSSSHPPIASPIVPPENTIRRTPPVISHP